MIVALVPTRNEADTIRALVNDLYEHVDRVWVIDDSDDDDRTWVRALGEGAWVYEGKGSIASAIRQGWKRAGLKGVDRLVTIDAGGSHSVKDLPRLLKSDADLVIGSRFVPGGAHSGARRFLSRAYARLHRTKGGPVKDPTSGYRVYSKAAMAYLRTREFKCHRHAFQAEVLTYAHRKGMTIEEIPITYKAGDSSLNPYAVIEAITHLARPLV